MLRALLGVGAVTVLALLASLDHYRLLSYYNRTHEDAFGIGARQERWRRVGRLLPEGCVAGYLSDGPTDEARGLASFFAAQYALAPRLLVDLKPGREVRWVVGEFSKPVDLQRIQVEHRLRLIRDFGDGLVLFEREGR